MSDDTDMTFRGELNPVRGVSGEAGSFRSDHDHHQGFNEAFDKAVQKYADMRGPTDGQKLSVTLSVIVSVENPGRIEGYVVDLG